MSELFSEATRDPFVRSCLMNGPPNNLNLCLRSLARFAAAAICMGAIFSVLMPRTNVAAQEVPAASPSLPVEQGPIDQPIPKSGVPVQTPNSAPEPTSESKPDPNLVVEPGETVDSRFGAFGASRSEDDLLLFLVRIGNIELAADLPGFFAGTSVLLPLGEYMEVLEFPIAVDVAEGTAEGWFIKENRAFSLNVKEGTVVINGKKQSFDRSMVEIHETDIFVDIRILPDWFPIDYSFDLANLSLTLKPNELLPLQQKLTRDTYRKRVFKKSESKKRSLPVADAERKLIGWPTVDVDMTTRFSKSGSGTSATNNSYSAQLTGELAYSSFEAFVSGREKANLSDLRVKLNRKDPDGAALGKKFSATVPLPITDFSFGDISPTQMPMVSRSRIGRGVEFSNVPLNSRTEFDRITLEGDLIPGWEIELYRNEILIDFVDSETDGRYEFEDVPLVFGRNVLKLIFYGPQGQYREETEIVNVGSDQVPTGEFQYRFAANEHDRRLLHRVENPDNDFEGRNRVVTEVRYGVSPQLSVVGNLAHIPVPINGQSRPFTYLGTGIRYTFEDVIGRFDVVNQLDRGWASKIAAQTRLYGVSVSGEHDIYRNFYSEQVSNNGAERLISKSTVRINGSIPQTVLPRIPLSLNTDYERRKSGSSKLGLTSRMSASFGRFNVSNSSTLTRTFSPDAKNTTISTSSLLASGRFTNLRVRAQASYATIPQIKLNSFNTNADYFFSEKFRTQLGFTRSFGTSRFNTFNLSLNYTLPFVLIGLSGSYTSDGNLTTNLRTSFSASRDPNSGDVKIASNSVQGAGLVALQIFLDKDLDGKFSDGDEPLEGVGFRHASGSQIKGATGPEGTMLISSLPVFKESEILVDLGSLADPFWQTTPEGIRVTPRPGSIINYVFPVVSSGEVDGTVWIRMPGKEKLVPASRITVELVDKNGEVTRQEKTAFDGFYILDFIKPGKYKIRIKAEDLADPDYIVDTVHDIEIGGEGTVVNGLDFILTLPEKPTDKPVDDKSDPVIRVN